MAPRKGDPKDARKGLEALRRRLVEDEAKKRAQPPKSPPPKAAPPSPASPAPSPPEPEDPEAFEREMKASGVGAIDPGRRRIARPPADARDGRAGGTSAAAMRPRASDDALFEEAMAGTRLHGGRFLEGDAHGTPLLDLHGFSEQDALHEAKRFVDLHRGPKAVIVRIITGRGNAGDAVLRPAIHAWLDRTSAITAWRVGHPAEGGEGMVVVRLKRRGGR